MTFTGSGTCTVDADQPGNGSWQAAPQAQQAITVEVPSSPLAQDIISTSAPPSPAATAAAISRLEGGSLGTNASVTASTYITTDHTCIGASYASGYQFAFGPPGHEVVYTVGDWCWGFLATPNGMASDMAMLMNASLDASGTTFSTLATVTANGDVLTVTANVPGSSMNGWDFQLGPNDFLWMTGFIPADESAPYTPTATATSGLPVTFSIDSFSTAGACSISGGVVTFTGSGTCTVDADQPGNGSWQAAPQVQQIITVS